MAVGTSPWKSRLPFLGNSAQNVATPSSGVTREWVHTNVISALAKLEGNINKINALRPSSTYSDALGVLEGCKETVRKEVLASPNTPAPAARENSSDENSNTLSYK